MHNENVEQVSAWLRKRAEPLFNVYTKSFESINNKMQQIMTTAMGLMHIKNTHQKIRSPVLISNTTSLSLQVANLRHPNILKLYSHFQDKGVYSY